MATKKLTMHYRRIVWTQPDDPNHPPLNMQQLLNEAHRLAPATNDRTFPKSDGKVQGMDFFKGREDSCGSVGFYDGEDTSVLPFPSREGTAAPSSHPAPVRMNFLKGESFYLVWGNHVVIVNFNLHVSYVDYYFYVMLTKLENDVHIQDRYKMSPIAEVDVIEALQREGVKEILLDASLQEASIRRIHRRGVREQSMRKRIFVEFRSIIRSLLREEQRDAGGSDLTVRVTIKTNKKHDDIAAEERDIRTLAQRIIETEEEDDTGKFTIVTNKDNRVNAAKLRIGKKEVFEREGDHLQAEDVFRKLRGYLTELERTGTTEL